MRQVIRPGQPVDFLTPDELVTLIPRPTEVTRIRAAQNIALNAVGNGQDEVYKVPMGYEFEARRVFFDLSTATDPATGNVALGVAGVWVAYYRSGQLIEYAIPVAPTALAQVPGVQTWGNQEGPYLRNAEVFEVRAVGLTGSAMLSIQLEGILRRPASKDSH